MPTGLIDHNPPVNVTIKNHSSLTFMIILRIINAMASVSHDQWHCTKLFYYIRRVLPECKIYIVICRIQPHVYTQL